MNLKRKDIIDYKNTLKRHRYSKKVLSSVNKGVVLLSASAVLSQIASNPAPVVEASNSSFSTRVTKSEFLNTISNHAKNIAAQNDLYASVMIAQAALETGWGNSTLAQAPYNNLFGIKGAYNGNSVNMDTLEDDGTGSYYGIVDSFKVYPTISESLSDYANVLTGNNGESTWRSEFYAGARYSNTSTYQDATAHLTGRYATDTSYGSKLNKIIAENNLAQYDMVRDGSNNVAPTPDESVTQPTTPPSNGSGYRVVAGDTYWSLAKRYGVTVAQLQEANGARNSNLAVGQLLTIPTTSEQPHAPSTNPSENEESTNNENTQPTTPSSYTVKAGDTYWSLANRYGVSVNELLSLNNATSSALRVGQALVIPGQTVTTPTQNTDDQTNEAEENVDNSEDTNTVTAPTTGNYQVRPGDTYWSLARRYNVSVSELQQMNNAGSSLLHVGQSLVVPSSSVQQATASVETDEETQTSETVENSEEIVETDTQVEEQIPVEVDEVAVEELPETSIETVISEESNEEVPAEVVENESVTEEVVEEVQETPEVTEVESNSYQVQAGDTLYSISKRYNINLDQLVEQNGGTVIRLGQTLNW